MKAVVLESNGVLRYKDVPDPKINEDECLIRVKSAGICNSDIYRAFENGAYRYPLIMGHEFSGEIIERGKSVKHLMVGQAVSIFPLLPCFKCEPCMNEKWVHCNNYDYYGSRRDGAFAEYISVKAWNLLPLPDGCDLNMAAIVEPLAVAIHTFKSISENKEGRILILGGGSIGLSLANLIKRTSRFKEIWIFDRNKFKLEIAQKFGFLTNQLNSGNDIIGSFEKYFDVVIEACGSVKTFRDSIYYCKGQAQLLWMGNIQGDLVFSKKEISSILRKEIRIQGVWNSDYHPEKPSDWSKALSIICKENWLKKLVSHCVPLSEGKTLLEDMYNVKKHFIPHSYLKTLLTIS